MDREELKRLRALADAATPGPWVFKASGDSLRFSMRRPPGGTIAVALTAEPEDVDFIAAARTALPALLDEVERLRAEVLKEKP